MFVHGDHRKRKLYRGLNGYPPAVTLKVVRDALKRGIGFFWMQPGAENPEAIKEAEAKGATVIHDGSCVLIRLHYREM